MAFSLRVTAHSEIGLVRADNQDSAYASPTLIAVADGMGGAAAGDLASAVAVKHLAACDGHVEGLAMLDTLRAALVGANADLADLIAAHPALDGMGTTVCGALFSGTQLGLIHIGDSRGYRLRGGRVTQLTHDHSWVQTLIDEGQLTPEEAAIHPKRSLLMKVLNGQASHTPDVRLVDVEAGDRYLFCSDGVSGMMTPDALARALRASTLEDASRRLVAQARRTGGFDNITLVLADVVEHDPVLDAVPPEILGAAAEVNIPAVPAGGGAAMLARLSDRSADGEPDDLRRGVRGRTGRADDEAVRTRPRGMRPRWFTPVASVLVVALVAGAALLGVRWWLDGQWYIGTSGEVVAIYQGVPGSFAGVALGRTAEVGTTRVADLPVFYADQVRESSIRPASLDAARDTLAQLDHKAQVCIELRQATISPPVSPPPTPLPTESPDATLAPSITTTAAPATDPVEDCP
ncbi:MAG: protein phosphatase 2C domain-containing protein [Actinomycetia bacterium]|nr:protein phosphatase 2C domain-containing protein [Actinomycetes bacterium]